MNFLAKKREVKFSPQPPQTIIFNWKTLKFSYSKETFQLSPLLISSLSFFIGIVGGIYGIGGGALMSPILLAFFRIPAYVFAGATLAATCITSIIGVLIFTSGGHQPDWLLGFLFGIGGATGLWLGAKIQKHLPQKVIKLIITFAVFVVGIKYIFSFILK